MDGAKSITDTVDISNDCGRQASCRSRSIPKRVCGFYGNENPGGSKIRAE